MALSPGTKYGPYEIEALLGAGGMGEVYRARDTRLDRTVAIKILPSHLSSDPAVLQRFEREARAISSLQHPHVCVLHDIGRDNGTDYLVMEYLEGETLANRLTRGPLKVAEALKIASQIAEALATAHRHGIVHRDLKPGNIMLTRSGAKLTDFGLAKLAAVGNAGNSHPDDALNRTVSGSVTVEGSIVGTFQYMAPEVLDGEESDARSDMFSFGCVLYEMISGRFAFHGKSRGSLVAAILEHEPEPLKVLCPTIPTSLEQLVLVCLAKDPDQRWQSARDLQTELQWIMQRATESLPPESRRRGLLPWILAATLAVLALVLFFQLRRPAATPESFRSWLIPPPGYSFVPFNFALSPDGKRLAFVAIKPDGKSRLWVRSTSTSAAQEISNSENAEIPFWAPDNRRLGFASHRKLQIVDLDSAEVRALAEVNPVLVGGTWNRDDVIVYAAGAYSTLSKIAAGGGTPTSATLRPGEGSSQAHRWPFFLPDGKHFLYVANWSSPDDARGDGLYAASLEGGEPKLISNEITGNVEYANGRLLYFRDRSIVAQPFDAERLTITGPPSVLTEQGVERQVAHFKAGFSSSATGVLVFQSVADSPIRMTWFSASGQQEGELPETGNRDPRLSPDGRFLAVTADEMGNGRTNIRVYDLARGLGTTPTSGGEDEFPAWSPDGRTIYYASRQGQVFSVSRVPADGSKPPEAWLSGSRMIPNSFTPDGRYLALMNLSVGGAAHIDIISTADRKLIQRFPGAEAQFSTDGHWIAYTFRGGEVFVQSFPGPGSRVQVSNAGGGQPRWSRDSSRLYYITPEKMMMMVRFDPTGKHPPAAPEAVMRTRIVASRFSFIQYDVTADGKRFIINSLPPGGGGPLSLLTNWTASKLSPSR